MNTIVSSSNHIANNANGKSFSIQPVHHRTRSLPLTEETVIDFSSQSPPNFVRLSSSFGSHNHSQSSGAETTSSSKINNNSMESIIEDCQNVDMSNNNGNRLNNGGNSSILKQLSKIANSNSHKIASSPSQLRKKRQHHNVMTASLRSTYHPNIRINIKANTKVLSILQNSKFKSHTK
jgi:hypothetical protein